MAMKPSVGDRAGEISWRSFGAEQGFGSEIAAADGAFHGGGPAGGGPIASEEEAGMAVCCLGRQRSTPGSGENVAAASLMTVA